MGSIDYGLGDEYYKRKKRKPTQRLSEGDRERIEEQLRATHENYEGDEGKQVRVEILEVLERFYVNDPAGPPIDIAELQDMVARDLI